jgi:hypothetical protein
MPRLLVLQTEMAMPLRRRDGEAPMLTSSASPSGSDSSPVLVVAQDNPAPEAEEEEEMPLLFMDQLPSNFQQSAQLAAIATFMADSDDDAAAEEPSETGNSSKQRRQRQQTLTRTRRRQIPYAKQLTATKEPKNKAKRHEPKTSDTKELQLFLSMFHVS